MTRVLVVENDSLTARWAAQVLRQVGHEIHVAYRGDEGLRLLGEHAYDVVIVDVGLPDRCGLSVIGQLRADGGTMPVIVMTADAEDSRMVAALDGGADDYLVKPVSAPVLQARVRAALRRGGVEGAGAGATGGSGAAGFVSSARSASFAHRIQVGGLTFDRVLRRVTVERRGVAEEVTFTPREFALLEYLVMRAGETVTRVELHEQVWGMRFDPGTNVVDATMSRVRAKAGEVDGFEIVAVRGVGYRVGDSDEATG